METFKERFLDALKRFFTSIKLYTVLVGLLASWLAKKGIILSPEMIEEIRWFFVVLLGAQGLTDLGKEGKKIEAAAPKAPDQLNIQNVAAPPESGEK